METFFLVILPLVLDLAIIVFMRTCLCLRGSRPIPRMLCYGLILPACIPVVGWMEFALLAIGIVGNTADGTIALKENRFTRYWFRS